MSDLSIPIGGVFNEVVHKYEGLMRRCVPHYLDLVESSTRQLSGQRHPEVICDLGSGTGNVSKLLLRNFPNSKYILIDASEEMMKVCQRRFSNIQDIQYHQCYFQDISLSAASIDLVVACMSLHHLKGDEKKEIYYKVYHALTHGGEFRCADLMIDRTNDLVHIPFLHSWKEHNEQKGSDEEEWKWLMDHYHTYDFPDSWESHQLWLQQMGFASAHIIFQENHWICWSALKSEQ